MVSVARPDPLAFSVSWNPVISFIVRSLLGPGCISLGVPALCQDVLSLIIATAVGLADLLIAGMGARGTH